MSLDRISKARARLLLDYPWWGSLSMRLHTEPDTSVETFSTDGTRLLYNPTFADSLTEAELIGVLAHEVSHCALLHPYRTGGRDLKEWNVACDYVINSQLLKEGFTLPSGALIDPQYDNMAAEQVYALRHKKPDPNGDQTGGGGTQPNPTGEFTKPDEPQPGNGAAAGGGGQPDNTGQPADTQSNGPDSGGPEVMTEADWQIAAEQSSAICAKAGTLPGDIARAAKAAYESQADWREILRRFIEQTVPSDYSWMNPNRRYIARGLYLPGMVKENTPRLAVAIDTSGSISQSLLDLFAAELTAILHESRPQSLDVLYCDTAVRHTESFTPDDPSVKLSCYGGGGTRFQPVFDRIATEPEPPACLIYFTDLEGPAPIEPEYPTLWVTTEAVSARGWFGDTVRIPEGPRC